jgi:hypothetical protein
MGLIDLIDDVFWLPPFNCDRTAKCVRQDFSIAEEVWNARREVIRADHSAELETARTELAAPCAVFKLEATAHQ